MPGTVNKCPFSKIGCKECAIYRARHGYIVQKEGETPAPRIIKKDDPGWQEKFREALNKKG
ncbi:MAG: hypothetical protein ABSE25_05590 [Syntrophorhabdales bacterium]|jgi:hypothetical protein